MPTLRSATLADIDPIKALAVDTAMFRPEETGFVDDMVSGFVAGTMAGHRWVVREGDDGAVVGAAYYAPEPFSDRVWNLYFIAVAPAVQGQGVGGEIMRHVEASLRERGPEVARVLVVETSSTDQYARTRAFYPKQGYVEEARIRQFYGPSNDKVVFWKSLVDR